MDAFTWIFSLLLPAVMVAFGWLMWKRPPREINPLLGYRTARSMKNQQTWDFAHRHIGKNWVTWGVAALVATVAVLLAVRADAEYVLIGLMTAQLAVLIVSIFPTEAALKKKFDEYGSPR